MPSLLMHTTNENTPDTFHEKVDYIKSKAPTPYGTIPKRRKPRPTQTMSDHTMRQEVENDRSIFSILYDLLFAPAKPPKAPAVQRTGFLPTTAPKADVAMSTVKAIAPIAYSSPRSTLDDEDDASCPPLSTSSSSTSSWSSNSSAESLDDASSISLLFNMLRDHHAQSHPATPPSMTPLEMYSLFESNPDEGSFSKKEVDKAPSALVNTHTLDATPVPVATPHEATPPPEPVENIIRIEREVRANPDYLRMIVAEINMMHANKIVCPLRPRGFLQKRSDPFLLRRSPLHQEVL